MNEQQVDRFRFVDSHTECEPTRVIVDGVPNLGHGTMADRVLRLKEQDWFRQCVNNEPRGWDALVGAIVCDPVSPTASAGVIFFNNTGYLNMCGHGTIGVAVTLYYLNRIGLGKHLLDTPVGTVEIDVLERNVVSLENVPSYRYRKDVVVEVEGLGSITGDIAWGGNWFFLVSQSPCELKLSNIRLLSDAARRVRKSLVENGITGAEGAEIDHIEFFGPAVDPTANSRNFVYCPGGAYDRSPCGTGSSAKIACLAADGKLDVGATWIQESITGSRFTLSYRYNEAGVVVPRIVGSAFVVSEGTLIRDAKDPIRDGIPAISILD